ncbi:MAG: metallophosphoesterase [Oribacterium sp.]|jgi:DNA repair exonuclease SbcCD nuclease subunit|nr:metallophosphoesterase [Oribacterium sp.]MDY6308643.1 metallophosphoesterase [Oribacterium sp.]MDY6316064.1 metallophosphoesterase [Oribacterium sp.]
MRFIHTADVHWGMMPDADMPWSKDRSNDIKASFRRIIDKARDTSADCLFISGDLFDFQPMNKDLKELNYLFSSIPATHVVIISGEHDYVSPNSALLSFNWSQNVHWFLSDQVESIYFSDINTEVYGFSYHAKTLTDTVIDTVKPEDNGRIHILLAHGGDQNHMPVDISTLSALPFDYIALGHLNSAAEIETGKIIYPGSPEVLSSEDAGDHGYYTGDINPISHHMDRLTFVKNTDVDYITVDSAINPKTTALSLLSRITQRMKKYGDQNIFTIRITGKHSPDTELDLSSLRNNYRILEFIDESEPDYDFSEIYRQHPSDIIGFYIRKLMGEDPSAMSNVEKQALYYGIRALLERDKENRT